MTQIPKINQIKSENSSQKSDTEPTSLGGSDLEKNIIHVAVKTCKVDADLVTSEKFLEEACKNSRYYDTNQKEL